MEWTPGPSAASRLMRVLHRKEVQNISTFLKPDGSSTSPGEDTADFLFRTHFPQSTPSFLPHYDHTPSSTSIIMEHFTNNVNPDTIRDSMSHFQSKKTPGSDGFKPVLLYLPPNVIYLLCVIYRLCLYLRYTPWLWKECTVIFLPKPGKDTYSQPSSYRPISLSNYLLKTLERLCSWHVDQCVRLHPLHPHQHGFRVINPRRPLPPPSRTISNATSTPNPTVLWPS